MLSDWGIRKKQVRNRVGTVSVYFCADFNTAGKAWLAPDAVESEPEYRNIGENAGILRDPTPEHGR